MHDAYCRFCHQLIHFVGGLWYHGYRRRQCNPPLYRVTPRGAVIFATPSHRARV